MKTTEELSIEGIKKILEFKKWYEAQGLPVKFDIGTMLVLSTFYTWLEFTREHGGENKA